MVLPGLGPRGDFPGTARVHSVCDMGYQKRLSVSCNDAGGVDESAEEAAARGVGGRAGEGGPRQGPARWHACEEGCGMLRLMWDARDGV
eukprot:3896275-Rhodomonas_salina.2